MICGKFLHFIPLLFSAVNEFIMFIREDVVYEKQNDRVKDLLLKFFSTECMWLISEILPLGSLFTNVIFFFPENVIMARLEFIKLVLHCIEKLTEQTNTLLY